MQTKDFVTAFRPKDGDLIYGRAEARGAYFAQFTPSQVKACNDYAAWVTIDQYNDYFGTSGDAIVAGPNIAKIRQHVAGKDPMTSVQDTLQKKPDLGFKQFDQREAYQSQVMKSRYAPTSVQISRASRPARDRARKDAWDAYAGARTQRLCGSAAREEPDLKSAPPVTAAELPR